MRILVTGANGFVGRALCELLLSRGHCVTGAVRGEPAAALLPAGVTPATVGSLGGTTRWQDALAGVDAVIHLAARVHLMNDASADPLAQYRAVNVAGTDALARAAAAAGVRRFVFASSVKALGEEAALPYTADSAPHPADPYGVSKLEAERALERVAEETGMRVVIVRPPLVYGPGVKANFLQMMKLVHSGVPLPLGSVANGRSLVYLGNLAEALLLCAVHPAAAGSYLVTDGAPVSTPELIRRAAQALGRPARLFPFPASLLRLAGKVAGKEGAVERLLGSLVLDDVKLRRELGWVPPHTMQQGLKETAQWFLEVKR